MRKPKHELIRGKERFSNNSYLYLRKGKPFGIIRVECRDCEMDYTMNDKNLKMIISNGSEDRFVYPRPNSSLKTIIKSNENQMIRVLAINSNGKVVSNVLDTFRREQVRTNNYSMKYIRLKNTVIVDILKSK